MKFKIPSFMRYFLYRWIDSMWEGRLSPDYDPRRTIVISGTPRGGTTWVAETLASIPGYLHLFEPLATSHVAETLSGTRFMMHPWEPLSPLEPSISEEPHSGSDLFIGSKYLLHLHIKRTISGKVRLTEYYSGSQSLRILRNMRQCNRLVVKFIRANLLLYWILKEFSLKGALLIRHPCAYVASELHQRDVGMWDEVDSEWLDRLRKYNLPVYERFDPSIANVIRQVKSTEELLALEWCIRTALPLRQPRPHPWFLTVYEGLIEDRHEWEMLCKYLDCPVPSTDAISRLSSTYQTRGDKSYTGTSVDKWRRHLSEKQIDDILRICSEMGVDFYDKTPYPKNLDKYRSSSTVCSASP